MIKILVDGLPKSSGGIGTLLINLVRYNDEIGNRDKFQFDFLIPENSEYIPVLKKNKYVFYQVPKITSVSYKKTIETILKKTKYDYLWINNTSKVNILLPRMAKIVNKTKIISHVHGVSTESHGLKGMCFKLIEDFQGDKYCQLIDIPLACSVAASQYFYPEYLLKKCKIVSNGIFCGKYLFNYNSRLEKRCELQFSEKDKVLGAVGRLTRVKNIGFLLNVVKKLTDEYKLIVLGDGEDRNILESKINLLNLDDRVRLLGNKDNVADYLCAMDIFVMPSLNEGMPFSLIEAQASGLPCVVSTGVAQETDLTGSVFFEDIDDENKWADRIKIIRTNTENRMAYNLKIKEVGYSIEESYRIFIENLL